MTEEMTIVSMEYAVENFLTNKVKAYVSIGGKIYAYIKSVDVEHVLAIAA
jgi:hypothetical protein